MRGQGAGKRAAGFERAVRIWFNKKGHLGSLEGSKKGVLLCL